MIRSIVSITFFGVLLGLFGPFCSSAYATQTYCVNTVSEFQDALNQAETDGEESRIDVQTGTYNLSSSLVYKPTLYFIPIGKLTIEGGYGVGCTTRVDDASLTVLQGDGSRFLRAYADNASVVVKTMTFNQVSIDVTNSVFGDECATTNIVFEFRRIKVNGGVLFVNAIICHDVVIRDSLFTNGYASNSNLPSNSSISIYTVQNAPDFAETTIINSTVIDGLVKFQSRGGAFRGTANLYNNIFSRSGTEIYAEATNIWAFNNRYDPISFTGNDEFDAGSLMSGDHNISSSPDLDATYRPNANSPMRDTGTSAVPDGLLSIDLYGGPRVVGSSVDRGALESPVDGSGVFTVTNTNASGAGSLADAVNQANAQAGYNTIKFNIAGSCPHRIDLSATLSIEGSTLIDGWSQPGNVKNTDDVGWNAAPCVILDGNGSAGTGISPAPAIADGNLQIRGLAFEGFSAAMLLTFGKNHLIFGNQFGGRVGTSGPILAGNDIAIIVAGSVSGTVIGGNDEPNRNLIGSSATAGVQFIGASANNNQVVNNLIGLDKNAINSLPNLDGVYISSRNNSLSENRISRNTRDGVVLSGSNSHDNKITGNMLGGSVISGPFVLAGNGRMGVLIDNNAHDNTIGPDNSIGNNGDSGVRVLTAAGGHNTIIANRINLNGAPGIDLGSNGVSANDFDPNFCDITLGCSGNRGQNFPVIENALRVAPGDVVGLSIAAHITTIYGAAPYRIDFYRSAECNSSGYGEGSHWIGSVNVVVANAGFCSDSNCRKDFSFGTLDDPGVDAGDAISATATSPGGDTSEFAACVLVENVITDRIFQDDFE